MEKSLNKPLLSEQHLIYLEDNKGLQPAPPKPKEKTIPCSGCKSELSIPSNSFCIRCPKCFTITAVQELSSLTCCRCNQLFYFPTGYPLVTCVCGQVYSTPNPALI